MARTTIKSHKKATDLNLTAELGDLLGLQTGSDSIKLKSADDMSEPGEKVEKSTVAAVEATINYVNKLLNESDEELPENPEDEVDDEDPSLDDVEDEDEDLGDDEDDDLGDDEDDDVEECDGPKKFFSEDDASMSDEEDGEDFGDDEDVEDDDEELGDMDDEDIDDDFEDGEDDLDDEDSEDDELDGEPTDDELDDDGEDMDDVTESYRWLFEDDESMGDGPDSEDMEDDSDSDGLSIDIPEDMDPNDVSVSVGGSEYVPDTSDDEDEDLGDLNDDELAGEDEGDEEEDTPVQEGYYPFLEDYFTLGEDDDPDIDDADPEYDDSEFDDDEESDDGELSDEEPEEEVTESAVMRALRRLIKEGERSDDSITADPSNSTGDAPIDSEGDIDDSEAEEKDLSGSEGEVTDSDIPIEKGAIQPEEAAELRWMARKLKGIMEGDDLDSHSDGDGKLSAEPLDDDASDMIGDINDNLSDDGELTDTGNGAVDDSESTLGTPDEADDDVEVEGDDVVSSNGEMYDTEEDEDEMLTDNYHMLMTAIREAYAKKKGKKKDKKVALKKVDKKAKAKKGKKKLSESNLGSMNFNVDGGDYYYGKDGMPEVNDSPKNVGPESSRTTVDKNPPLSENRVKTLEDTALGSFNAQEMTSVLRNLNNAFGAGKVAKEVRDSSVVSEVSVPKWSLPIAENASWDGLKAGKLLIETAYKSESKVNTDLLKKTHLYWEGTGSKESDYKFPIASMVEGQAQIIPQAIDEATTLFASPSFISRFSESALKKIRNVLDFYNEKMGKKSPWKENKQINVTEAAKITMIDRTQYNPLAVLKRLSEQEKAKKLINLRG